MFNNKRRLKRDFLNISLHFENHSIEIGRMFLGKSRPLAVIRRKTRLNRAKKLSNHPFEAQNSGISFECL